MKRNWLGEENPNFKHGMTGTRYWYIWQAMKKRCLSKKDKDYKNYGGRGIIVCERWKDFNNFFNDTYESYLKHCEEFGIKQTSLDRVNNNGNYEPSNCRWATWKEQNNNRSNNINSSNLLNFSLS